MAKFVMVSLLYFSVIVGGIRHAQAQQMALSLIGKNSRVDVPASHHLQISVQPDLWMQGTYFVSLKLDPVSRKALCALTKTDVGEPIAVVVRCKIVIAPVLLEPLCNGEFAITGEYNKQTAEALANEIRTGGPACLDPVS